MAEKITARTQDFSQWYQDIVIQAKLADYSPDGQFQPPDLKAVA